MKILQLITLRQYRGAEVFAVQLSQELQAQGVEVFVRALYAPPSEKALTVENLHIADLSRLASRAIPHYSILKQIAILVKEQKIQVVQANASDNLKYAVLSRLLFGWMAPIVFRNASLLSAWLRNPLHKAINRWLLLQADAIACVSRKSLQDLKNELGIPESRLHYLPIGTHIPSEINRYVALNHLRGLLQSLPEEAFILFHVGAFSPEKNQQALIDVLCLLPEHIKGRPVHVVCVGEGSLRKKVMRYAIDQGMSKRAHFLGYRDDVHVLLPCAHAFALPSHIEGTPGVLLEAAMQGVPVVAYDVGSVVECLPVQHGGALVPHDDVKALASTIQELLINEDYRQAQAKTQKAFVEAHYSLSKVGERFLSCYQELLRAK